MAAILSKEQQKACELIRAIGKLDEMHVWVVSPPNEPRLKIQVKPCCRAKFMSKMIHEWNWCPKFVGMTTRTTDMGFDGCLVEVFEVDVAKQLISLPEADARKIPGDD